MAMASDNDGSQIKIDLKQLLHVQIAVANCFERACVSSAKHSDLFSKVELMSNNARTIHLDTTSLITNAGIALNHMIEKMIPLVFKGIQSQNTGLLERAFTQVIERAEATQKEIRTTADRYLQLQNDVKQNVKTIEIINANEQTGYENAKLEIDKTEDLAKAAERELNLFERKKAEQEATLEFFNEELKRLKDAVADSGKITPNKNPGSGLQNATFANGNRTTYTVATVFKVVGQWWSSLAGAQQEQNHELNNKLKEMKDIGEKIHQLDLDSVNIMGELQQKKNDVITTKQQLQRLRSRKLAQVDALPCYQALTYFENLQPHFHNILLFWRSMALEVSDLKRDLQSKPTFHGEQIERRFNDYVKEIRTLLEKSIEYSRTSKMEIHHLYNFLSMTRADLSARDGITHQTALE